MFETLKYFVSLHPRSEAAGKLHGSCMGLGKGASIVSFIVMIFHYCCPCCCYSFYVSCSYLSYSHYLFFCFSIICIICFFFFLLVLPFSTILTYLRLRLYQHDCYYCHQVVLLWLFSCLEKAPRSKVCLAGLKPFRIDVMHTYVYIHVYIYIYIHTCVSYVKRLWWVS